MRNTDLTERSQDYLKVIYDREEWDGGPATLSDLADTIGQRRSTASEAVKRLTKLGLVDHAPYGGVTLTDAGREIAIDLVRRHRLVETFLVRYLDYGIDEVHDEAEVLEHAVSDRFIARVDAAMGHPTHDPHGDPIPSVSGEVVEGDGVPLSSFPQGTRVRVVRVRDRDSDLLRYLDDQGIGPGVEVTLAPRPYEEMAVLRSDTGEVSVAAAALDSILAVES